MQSWSTNFIPCFILIQIGPRKIASESRPLWPIFFEFFWTANWDESWEWSSQTSYQNFKQKKSGGNSIGWGRRKLPLSTNAEKGSIQASFHLAFIPCEIGMNQKKIYCIFLYFYFQYQKKIILVKVLKVSVKKKKLITCFHYYYY